MTDIDWDGLRAAAVRAMRNAYARYSGFPVGAAALVSDGRVVVGCNVENASYGLTLCAECGVVSALHATGGGQLIALACVDGLGEPLMPCGRCRQLLYEHGGPNCLIDHEDGPVALSTLLPYAFGPENLADVEEREAGSVPIALRRLRGRGTVFVHPDIIGGQRVWTGYWERSTGSGDEPAGILEEAPNWPDVAEAVAWGRNRTARVVVVSAEGETFWAGEADPPAEIPRRWAP
jgi:cytidine deaminase